MNLHIGKGFTSLFSPLLIPYRDAPFSGSTLVDVHFLPTYFDKANFPVSVRRLAIVLNTYVSMQLTSTSAVKSLAAEPLAACLPVRVAYCRAWLQELVRQHLRKQLYLHGSNNP